MLCRFSMRRPTENGAEQSVSQLSLHVTNRRTTSDQISMEIKNDQAMTR